jgi:hypothetical protein
LRFIVTAVGRESAKGAPRKQAWIKSFAHMVNARCRLATVFNSGHRKVALLGVVPRFAQKNHVINRPVAFAYFVVRARL